MCDAVSLIPQGENSRDLKSSRGGGNFLLNTLCDFFTKPGSFIGCFAGAVCARRQWGFFHKEKTTMSRTQRADSVDAGREACTPTRQTPRAAGRLQVFRREARRRRRNGTRSNADANRSAWTTRDQWLTCTVSVTIRNRINFIFLSHSKIHRIYFL